MAPQAFDVIVVGLGGVGSAALYHCARRGARVLGLEQFHRGHERGSSFGHTRIIRKAYYEHPDYVPLVLRAYELWEELSEASHERLFQKLGLLQVGRPNGPLVQGVLESARIHALDVEQLEREAALTRFPGIWIAPEMVAVFETGAGCLFVERCVLAHIAAAERHGAVVRCQVPVTSFSAGPAGVTVATTSEDFHAEHLIVAGGAWASRLLADLRLPLMVLRKVQFWFADGSPIYSAESGFPAFLFETQQGEFYGLPALDARGLKLAEHSGGDAVADATNIDRSVHPQDSARVLHFAGRHLPELRYGPTSSHVCMYTMSPDQHFIVDRHPSNPRVVFAAGLSGHGFKFTSALGEALADLALRGDSPLPIGFLGLRREALAPRRG